MTDPHLVAGKHRWWVRPAEIQQCMDCGEVIPPADETVQCDECFGLIWKSALHAHSSWHHDERRYDQ